MRLSGLSNRAIGVLGILFAFGTMFVPVVSAADGESFHSAWSIYSYLRQPGEAPTTTPPPAIETVNPVPDTPDIALRPVNNRTLSENSVFMSPVTAGLVLVGNNCTDWPVTTLFGTGISISSDGGATWTNQDFPGAPNSGDPAVVIDLNDRFVVGFIDNNSGQGVAFSADLGATWTQSTIATVPDPVNDLLDKNHLMVDNAAASPFVGNLYSAWTEFVGGGANANNIAFSRSTDGGATWSGPPMNISAGVNALDFNQGVNIQTGPAGEVYATWAIYDAFPGNENAIGFNRSTDGGVTWGTATRILNNIQGVRQGVPGTTTRANSFPSMAVDVSGGANNGNIYIVWTNRGVPGINGGDPDIYMVRSTDGGATFQAPVRVNTDATLNGQWFPWITCDPATGNLFAIFYDKRDDANNSLTTTYVAQSTNGGQTWTDFRIGDVQFTPAPIPGLAPGYFGDYLGIAARSCSIIPVWSDNRSIPVTAYASPLTIDTAPPTILCPVPIVVECTGNLGTPATDPAIVAFLGGATATDDCSIPTITNDAPAFFPLGTTTVTFTATDGAGNTASCSSTVTVVDTTLPTIDVVLSRYVLWPPNHKMVTINAAVTIADLCDPSPTFVLVSITSDEPDNGLGDGDRPDDIQGEVIGAPDTEFQLRSERSGRGDGRVYTIVYRVTDSVGNSSDFTTYVTVPHDQRGVAAGGVGLSNDGKGFERDAAQYSLIVPGSAQLDVTRIDPATAQVGHHLGVLDNVGYSIEEVNGDGVLDLSVVFTTQETTVLRQMQDEGLPVLVGFRYEDRDGMGYWIEDIFSLGPPIDNVTDAGPLSDAMTSVRPPQPNPFTQTMKVAYRLAQSAQVDIGVFDAAGRRVRTLHEGAQSAGQYEATWNGYNDRGLLMPAGVYFVRAHVGDREIMRRVQLIR